MCDVQDACKAALPGPIDKQSGPSFSARFYDGFKSVYFGDYLDYKSDQAPVCEAGIPELMQRVHSLPPLYCEPDPAPLENCLWLGPVCAADECQAMEGTDSDRGKPPQSSTVKTRTGAGPRNVDLNLPVLIEKALRKLTLEETAKELGISATSLKTHLRILGIKDWRRFRQKPCMYIAHVSHQAV